MDFLNNVDPWAYAALTFAVIGFVQLYAKLVEKNWKDAGKIAVAAGIGALVSSQVHVTWFIGLLIGLNASGLVTAVTRLGGGEKTNP